MSTPSAHTTHSTLVVAGAAAALAVSAFAAGAWYANAKHAAAHDAAQPTTPTAHQNGHSADGALASGNLSPTESVTLSLPPTPHFRPRGSQTGPENGSTSGSYAQALERSASRNGNGAAAGAPALSRSSSMSSVMSMAISPGPGAERAKLVVLVRSDLLKMWGKQKLGIMCMHVALAQFKKQYKKRDSHLTQWELEKGPKVILRVSGEAELVQVLEAAKSAGLPTHSMLEPVGQGGRTRVIAALGPAPADALNAVTSQLVLL